MEKLILGIQPDDKGFSDRWFEFFQEKGIETKVLDLLNPELNLWDEIKDCYGIMWRWNTDQKLAIVAPIVLQTLERLFDINVYPNFKTTWHYDNKIAQYFLFMKYRIPVPKTWILWNYDVDFLKKLPLPLVFKFKNGASSSNVTLLKTFEELNQMALKMFYKGAFDISLPDRSIRAAIKSLSFSDKYLLDKAKSMIKYIFFNEFPPFKKMPEKNYMLLQEFLPNNDFDTRVTVIGNKAFAFRRWNRKGDFRASGSGLIDYDISKIEKDLIKMAFDLSTKCNFQSMAYDYLFDKEKYVLSEISYTFAAKPVFDCPGHWDNKLNWHEGHVWPQDVIAEDFIVNCK